MKILKRVKNGLKDRTIESRLLLGRDLKYFKHYFKTKPIIIYSGWVGFGNLGDEILFSAHEKLFPDFQLIPYQRSGLSGVGAKLFRHKISACILGGGTLINLSEGWLKNVEGLSKLKKYTFTLGTGVSIASDKSKLDIRWTNHLKKFNFIGLRGPLSKNVIKNSGITGSRIVGDTALSLTTTIQRSKVKNAKDVVGICVGHSPEIPLPIEPVKFANDCVVLIKEIIRQGKSVVLLPVWEKDNAYNVKIHNAVDSEHCRLINAYKNFETFNKEVAQCDVFVGQKLHGAVISTMANVPTLMLSYNTKCLDYMLSIEMGGHTIDLTSYSTKGILDSIENLFLNKKHIQKTLKEKIQTFKLMQQEVAEDLTSRFMLNIDKEVS